MNRRKLIKASVLAGALSVVPKQLLANTDDVKTQLSCDFTKADKKKILKKYNTILDEVIFTDGDCPKNDVDTGARNFYGVIFENGEQVFVPVFYFNKNGQVLCLKDESKKAIPPKKAILEQVHSACKVGRECHKKHFDNSRMYIYVIRSEFDKEAVGILTNFSPVKYKLATGATKI